MKIHEKRQVVLYVPIAIWLISPWILMFHKRYFPIMYLKWLFEFLMICKSNKFLLMVKKGL
ncbi:hypothetical protein Ahy_B06g082973 isoform B [Arachis hypogaea]|uniref:Uncharacterized protein n=2 Tax=Arachis hypogaea TaxID=3818 RepID=A0A444YP91_ARAHY|nr:hypothetical protein Ahy_B06g082973 isoform B [Arachis hypogaea]